LLVLKHRLKTLTIPFDERRCQFRALFELLNKYRIIIEKEHEHEIFINVSTGNKIEAIAGMMAAMMFHSEKMSVNPYCAIPENYEIKPKERTIHERIQGCHLITQFFELSDLKSIRLLP
jgi:hypothetical protein